jgi:hypothetical protein
MFSAALFPHLHFSLLTHYPFPNFCKLPISPNLSSSLPLLSSPLLSSPLFSSPLPQQEILPEILYLKNPSNNTISTTPNRKTKPKTKNKKQKTKPKPKTKTKNPLLKP